MPDTYAILGFCDIEPPTALYTSDSATEADRWRRDYISRGDWGGYDSLALYEVGPDQTADSIHLHDSPIDTLDREDDSRVICETCDRPTDPDDISTTEEGQGFCSGCGDSDRIRWMRCDRQGEAWAYLA